MKYKVPTIENTEQWVPIVAKNRDYLIGYINGFHLLKNIVFESLENNGICVNMRGIDLCLDSSRFNDVLENGKRESKCTDEELKEYYRDIIQTKIAMVKEQHPDNDNKILNNCYLEVDCPCGMGVYMLKNPKEVPNKTLKCDICGRILIDYTEQEDDDLDYDGDISHKNHNDVINEITKAYAEELQNNESDEDDDE